MHRAAKWSRLSVEKKNARVENSFGICLEPGIRVHKSLFLAAHFYRRAADQGNPDRANNFTFCLEHGRGVPQNVEMGRNLTNPPPIGVIPKQNSTAHASFACSIDGGRQRAPTNRLLIPRHAIACLKLP
jgi:hypothetical protein